MAFNQKNPPWQRNTGQNIAGMQTIVSFPQGQPVFNQNLGIQQQLLPQMGLQQQQIYSTAVQYPTSRQINTMPFQTQQQSAQVSGSSKFNPNQRVFSGTGHVTKTQNDFGFIDEEVFFHKNVCKGSFPKIGDRVLVEASYNQNMPFKWNATRVQVLQSASSSSTSSSRHVSSYSSGQNSGSRNRYSPSRKSPERHGHRSSNHDSRSRDDDEDRRRRRDDSDRYREKQRDRTPDRDRRDRERSPLRKLSPKRRKVRPIPRYMVQMPKQILTQKNVDILEIRRRYHTMYIPSDFFTADIRWVDAFPPNEPFTIRKPCAFHVMHKEVEPLHSNDLDLEPADADYLYSAKVMLMGTPPMIDFYDRCFSTAEDRDRYEDERDYVHPTRLINFLVGIRGKNETMAIGGPWSPSLDGDNPHSNPNVLIKTAIRTCLGLTGIDLSKCTRWYRFVELYYRRSETYHKGRLIPARIETVVIFVPDVRSCQPTAAEWTDLHLSYKAHLDRIINSDPENSDSLVPVVPDGANSTIGSDEKTKSPTAVCDPASPEVVVVTDAVDKKCPSPVPEKDISTSKEEASSTSKDVPQTAAADTNEKDKKEEDEVITIDSPAESPGVPTNFALLDVKKMKVVDLKAELEARKLSTEGVKNILIARLTKALDEEKSSAEAANVEDEPEPSKPESIEEHKPKKDLSEKQADKAGTEEEFETMENVDMSEVTVIDEYDSTKSEEKSNDEPSKKVEIPKLTEKERLLLEKRYSLPDQPHIIVHPSRTAKSGKFDCAVMSLSVLLDYRPEDSKEHSFEISLFAELFNEMLTRDFGFNIFKALHNLPGKKDDDSKKASISKDTKDVEDEKKTNGDGATDKDSDDEVKIVNDDKDDKERAKERERKRSRFNDGDEDDQRRKEKEKVRTKYFTADRDLLLSFVYFDVSHCGYIFDKDVEDLFYTIGLNLSRSQIRRMVSKAVTRDSLYYRKLTDKPIEQNMEETKEESKTSEASDSNVKTENKEIGEETEMAKSLAIGNCNYVEQLKDNLELVLKKDLSNEEDAPMAKKIKLEPAEDKIPETQSGLVVHKGAVIDISKLLEQMRQSEKSREDTSILLTDIRRQNADLQKNAGRANEKIKDQSSDIKTLTKKLIEAEQNLRDVTKKSNEYFSTLSNVYDRVSVIVHRPERKRSTSISSSRRGNSRDRNSRKDSKHDKDQESQKDITVEATKSEESISTMDITPSTVVSGDSKECIPNKNSEEDSNGSETAVVPDPKKVQEQKKE
ncbi:cell division cycle and apoptosis regulator protein 1-like [Uranotaenia lowii]|uniref:cell division cycle and apoptosis regulator protein 1-like n=1 Tax=Uranotaenia lowii TaxID=190385 RepID=UPI00247AD7C7|nr:cell division cycle and apoptosis regulator protein 1-like [Uranotaenia lowii]